MNRILSWFSKMGFDGTIIVILGFVAIGFVVYDFIGGTQISPRLLVGVLSLLLVEVVLRRIHPQLSKETLLKELVQKMDEVLKPSSVHVERDLDKMFSELLASYHLSRESINIISWKNLKSQSSDPRARRYFEETPEIVRKTPSVCLRWLVWTPEHLDVVETMSHKFDTLRNSEIRFLQTPESEETPIIPCVIVDKSEINFGWGYLGRTQIDQLNMTLRDPKAVEAFDEYFTYLWQKSKPLKAQGEPVDTKAVARARKSFDGASK